LAGKHGLVGDLTKHILDSIYLEVRSAWGSKMKFMILIVSVGISAWVDLWRGGTTKCALAEKADGARQKGSV